jgi:hypothetical protein
MQHPPIKLLIEHKGDNKRWHINSFGAKFRTTPPGRTPSMRSLKRSGPAVKNPGIFCIQTTIPTTWCCYLSGIARKNARAFMANPDLKGAMEEAGVTEPPEACLLEEYDRGTV